MDHMCIRLEALNSENLLGGSSGTLEKPVARKPDILILQTVSPMYYIPPTHLLHKHRGQVRSEAKLLSVKVLKS